MDRSLFRIFFSLKYQKRFFLSLFLLTIITRDKAWQKTFSLKCKFEVSMELWYLYEARRTSQLGKIRI